MSLDLARRAVACKGFRWMPGMLTLEEIVPPAITLPLGDYHLPNTGWDPARVLHADEGDTVRVCTVFGKVRDIHDTALPDLTDPATLGCLLALVREAWGCPDLSVVGTPEDWRIDAEGVVGVRDLHSYPSETAALVAALEAAP